MKREFHFSLVRSRGEGADVSGRSFLTTEIKSAPVDPINLEMIKRLAILMERDIEENGKEPREPFESRTDEKFSRSRHRRIRGIPAK